MIEYLLHRFAFHGFAPHYQHHEDPTDPTHILAPLQLSLPVLAALFILLWQLAGQALVAALIVAGVLAGYLVYESLHLRIHSTQPGGWLLRALRKQHFYHHFADHSSCYGVTSPVWDLVFRTRPKAPFRTATSGSRALVKG
jgi:sterol desaturase/sphingolipid hydroxylase (fatty acid hydroxylase superfamily)